MNKLNLSLSPKGILSKGIIIPALLVSLAASLITVELSAIILPHWGQIVNFLDSSYYGSYYDGSISTGSTFQLVIIVIWVIIFCLFYGLLIFAPAIWFGAKRGWKGGLLVVAFEFMWLVFFGVLLNIYVPRYLSYGNPYPYPCGSGITCAEKPVIYLYPTKEEKVSVQLDYAGTLTDIYPNFTDQKTHTWDVVAKPDGSIHNPSDGQDYSYLFWEGADKTSYDLSTGFVVKGSDTALFLQNQLAKMGLEPKEYNEFIAYWLPKLQHNSYNLIHFAGKQYTDTAKLNISPTPDSVLRVFMVAKPLAEPQEVAAQTFPAFERKGFTVVEWGGELLQ